VGGSWEKSNPGQKGGKTGWALLQGGGGARSGETTHSWGGGAWGDTACGLLSCRGKRLALVRGQPPTRGKCGFVKTEKEFTGSDERSFAKGGGGQGEHFLRGVWR